MRKATFVLALAACGGGTNPTYSYNTYDDGGDGPPPPPNGTNDLDCDLVPDIDPDGLNCEELATALVQMFDAAAECNTKSDCQTLSIPCENWDAAPGCYAIVNSCLTENDIDKFHPDAAGASGCDTVVPGFPDTDCQCGSPPMYDCVSGVCREVFDYP